MEESIIMTKQKTVKKVVKNELTGKTYTIRKRSEVNPEYGTIRGVWKK